MAEVSPLHRRMIEDGPQSTADDATIMFYALLVL
jgi:hypothetical protein